MIFLSKNITETQKIANIFLNKILDLKGDKATVVGLFGDLGSGKTTFSQALGKSLNINEVMTSPTFVIEKRYNLINNKYSKLIHIDAYRLENGKEMLSLDFQNDLNNPKNLILIEWPENIQNILPADLLKLNFKFINESEREIVLEI